MAPIVIGSILDAVGKIAGNLITTDKDRLSAQIELEKLHIESAKVEASLVQGQLEINKVEASNPNTWVSGARPMVLWVCAVALAWTFIAHPMLMWLWSLLQALGAIPLTVPAPPTLDNDNLWVILSGILGLGGYRTFEKIKDKARN